MNCATIPKDNLIMIASPAETPPFVTFISTTSYKVVGTLVFDGKKGNGPNATNGLEQCGWSPSSGKFYQNVPAIDGPAGEDSVPGAVAVINPKNMKVERLFPIPLEDCAGPQGMAIGPNDQILEGCNAASPNGHRNTVVLSQKNGSILAVLQDLGGADEVWFNEGDGHYIIPSCNTPCRTIPSAICAHWSRGTGDRRRKHSPVGPNGFCREPRPDRDVPGPAPESARDTRGRRRSEQQTDHSADPGSWRYSTALHLVALR